MGLGGHWAGPLRAGSCKGAAGPQVPTAAKEAAPWGLPPPRSTKVPTTVPCATHQFCKDSKMDVGKGRERNGNDADKI